MAEQQYDLFFSGQLLDGHFADFVKADIQQIFKADAAYLERLFSGQEQVIKRGVDKATAIKFQQAFKKAGAKLIVKVHQPVAKPEAQQTAPPNTPQAAQPTTQSQADKPAKAPAAAPAGNFTLTDQAVAGESDDALIEHHQPNIQAPISEPNWDLAAAGSTLVEPSVLPTAEVDTSHLTIAQAGASLNPSTGFEAPEPVIDTSALEIAPNQGNIETLADDRAPVSVDTSHLSVEK